jgi:hypothetical protein
MVAERLPGQRLRLSDLALVMGKHVVFAAGVQVDGVAQIFTCHDRALDVPARKTPAERRVPLHEVPIVFLPQGKVGRRALIIVLHHVANGLAKFVLGVTAQLAIVRKALDTVIDTGGSFVGMAILNQGL